MAKTKPIINVVFVGHVDHGKSTTIGRLMYDSGNVPETEMEKLKAEAQKHGKIGFEFAFVMDKFKEERERGVTIDLSYQKLITNKYEVTIIDAPGHKDFIKNMITGASQADAAFLTVSAKDGVQPQTKEHVWLLRTMGVGQVAVAVKKSTNMPWYKGPTILEQMDLFTQPEKPISLPLRMPLQDVYEITGIGTVPVGKIETGI